MIIDLLDKYPIVEQERLLEITERWFMSNYHRHPDNNRDIYREYRDTPYWGNGPCENGKCTRDVDEDDECCEGYEDKIYNEWFYNLITEEERDQMMDIESQIIKQI